MQLTQQLAQKIQTALPQATVTVEDPNNDGAHLTATVIAPEFAGKSRIAQHKMVYAALGNAFETDLHALQLITRAPDQAIPQNKETHPCL